MMKYLLTFLVLIFFSQKILAQAKPNIVFIMADDLGYGDLGINGQKKIKTPAIDRLAASGMKFSNYYSGNTVCAPSRETLLTGRTTGNTFIRGNFLTDQKEDPALPPEKLTIAEYLKNNGYKTALIGKWGLGGEGNGPNTQGFDYSFGYLDQIHAHNYYTNYLYENGRRFPIPENNEDKKELYSADLMISKSLDYLDTIDHQAPFFLYLAITLPHGAYNLKDEGAYSHETWSPVFKKYAAMVSKLDSCVNLIVNKLNEKGVIDNTIIVLTSDNGANPQFAKFFNSNYIFRGNKRDLYDGGIHVPLIISWPMEVKLNSSTDFVCAAWDFFPTFVDVLKKPANVKFDGVSILPVLMDREPLGKRPPLYWEYYEYNYNWNKPGMTRPRNWLENRAIRDGKWKAVINNIHDKNEQNIELYNLSIDPSEKNNIAKQNPKTVRRMEFLFKKLSNSDSPYFPYRK